ncbi:hypothetical protein SAMD00023353_1500380 [Rosellinia necatrix]|uniref:Uncharacterized protein n=1 Tax=Rosellinia necatrix TaxID=77044 RepID=A0A1W2TJ15_ROSNE|nr:hypothetical protein SAMD00023353_1500380 [Rosellinia necatrix]
MAERQATTNWASIRISEPQHNPNRASATTTRASTATNGRPSSPNWALIALEQSSRRTNRVSFATTGRTTGRTTDRGSSAPRRSESAALRASMASIPTTTGGSSRLSASCDFRPDTTRPAAAAAFVRGLARRRPASADVAAAELAPLYGFGAGSGGDVIARLRAQAVFASPELTAALNEFYARFVGRQYGLRVADWAATMALVRERLDNNNDDNDDEEEGWWWRYEEPSPEEPPLPRSRRPEHHYARFLVRALAVLLRRQGSEMVSDRGRHMLLWLRRAAAADDGRRDDVCWVLFHALMYLHLVRMADNRAAAPLADRARDYARRLARRACCSAEKEEED